MHASRSAVLSVVTGANRGIGLAASRALARKGHRVIMTARDEQRGRDAVQALRAEDPSIAERLEFHRLDVANAHSVHALKEYVEKRVAAEKPDAVILVNNAGVLKKEWTEEEFNETIASNVAGPVHVTSALLPTLRQRKWSMILNISSGWGSISFIPHGSHYRGVLEQLGYGGSVSARTGEELLPQLKFVPDDKLGERYPGAYKLSKASLNLYTQLLAQHEGQHHKIFAAAIDPGWVRTDMGGSGATRSVEEGIDTLVWLATQAEEAIPWQQNGRIWHQRKLANY